MNNRKNTNISFEDFVLPDAQLENLPNQLIDVDRNSKEKQVWERYKQDTKHRDRLVKWMMVVVSAWLFIAAGIVITQLCINHILSDTVLCALLTTTTANVLGLAVIVLRGLFHQESEEK